jgi:O-antigen ligase
VTSTAGSPGSPASSGLHELIRAHTFDDVERGDVIAVVALLTSGSLFYVIPWAPLYLLALLITVCLALWKPVLSLVLVPASAPFFMDPKHIGHFQPAPQEVFLAVSVIALAARAATRPRLIPNWNRLVMSPFTPPALLFVLAATLSSVLAVEHHLAFRALYQLVLEPVLFFALLVLFVDRRADWILLVATFVAVGIFLSCVGIVQLLTGSGLSLVPRSSVLRVKAFYGSPDNLGLLLDRVLPFWLAFLLFGSWRRVERWLMLAGGLLLFVALAYTYSRGAWFAVAASAVVLMALRPGWTRVASLVVVVLAGLGAGVKANSVVHLLQAGHAQTGQKRIDIWRSSIHMIRDHPVLGIGPDNFGHYYAPRKRQQLYSPCRGLGYLDEKDASDEPCLSHPHQEVLDFWLSTGILGLVAAVWLQVVFWRQVFRAWSSSLTSQTRVLLLGASAAMLASLLHGLVDNSYFLMDLSVLFWMLCALALFCSRECLTEVSA